MYEDNSLFWGLIVGGLVNVIDCSVCDAYRSRKH